MAYTLICQGWSDEDCPFIGQYLKSYNPNADHSKPLAEWTATLDEAMSFDSVADALACWKQVRTIDPIRKDGKPNRPLTAFTVEVRKIDDIRKVASGPICIGCHKRPNEIDEYKDIAKAENCTPDEFVKREEGTYNNDNGHFLCTACYIKAGQPTGKNGRRWIAP